MEYLRIRETVDCGHIHPKGHPVDRLDIPFWEQEDSPAHAWMKKHPGARLYRARRPNVDTHEERYHWVAWDGTKFVHGVADELPYVGGE